MTRPRIQDWSKPEKLILLQGWRMNGLTIEQVADNIGIGKTTIYEWMKKNPNIANALKIGREQADNIIENALFNKAKGGDVTAMIFWLKNRRSDRWREKREITNTFKEDFEIKIGGNKDAENNN
jgi:DNA-binding XRE family transcriptional regulator